MADDGVAAAQRVMTKLAAKVPGQAFGLLPIIPLGMQASEVEEAEKSGDQQRVAEETAQLGLEAASTVAPVADVLNIGSELVQGYRDLRSQGVTHGQMLEAAVGLGKKVIERPDKAAAVLGESIKEIPGMTLKGYKYMFNKASEALTSAPIPLGY